MTRTLTFASRLRIRASATATESISCTATSIVLVAPSIEATIAASRSSGPPRSSGPRKHWMAPPAKSTPLPYGLAGRFATKRAGR
jgi:hypothetical protein